MEAYEMNEMNISEEETISTTDHKKETEEVKEEIKHEQESHTLLDEVKEQAEEIGGFSFDSVVYPDNKFVNSIIEATEHIADNNTVIRDKVNAIKIDKYINVIHIKEGKQVVTAGQLLSLTNTSVTISDESDFNRIPINIPFDQILDLYEVKKAKKNKDKFSIFKLNKSIKEFFTGTKEEREAQLKQKLEEKELKEKLKIKK